MFLTPFGTIYDIDSSYFFWFISAFQPLGVYIRCYKAKEAQLTLDLSLYFKSNAIIK